jgi:uncharacterized protein
MMDTKEQMQGGAMRRSPTRFSITERYYGLMAMVLLFLSCLVFLTTQAASFDCKKASTPIERFICENPRLSELDSKLGKVYTDALQKATPEQKKQLIAEQKHWLQFTRNICDTETCLKHAYWSRQAALETWFEPRSPLYKKESEKAEDIKRVLASAPLNKISHSDSGFCKQIFSDLKQMNGIRFVDPIVQTQSYEDPALDPWKQNCRTMPPFHFSYQCERNVVPADADDVLDACKAAYGLPPFKLYELPPASKSSEKRYILYNNDAYGPMNRDYRKPKRGVGFVGFEQIHLTRCLGGGSQWERGEKAKSSWTGVHADASYQGDHRGENYNSIFVYENQYYFLILHKIRDNYWLEVRPVDNMKFTCSWSPVKP